MSTRAEAAFYKKTRNNAIVKLVRERYLRRDIPCSAACCPIDPPCQSSDTDGRVQQHALLSAQATHYVIPDMSIILRYMEILEQEEITGVIFCQTIIARLQQHDRTRTYRKLRQIVNDSRRSSVVFYNEVFASTRIERLPNETSTQRDWRALCTAAVWYNEHLQQQKRLILLSETFGPQDLDAALGTSDHGIQVYTTKQYLLHYFPDHALLQNLANVLADAVLDDDIDRIRFYKSSRKADNAVQGFSEYKSTEELEAGIKSARYFTGTLKCRSGRPDHAHIQVDGRDILIVGNENLNRAVSGDSVVVELLSERNWQTASNNITFGSTSAGEDDDLRMMMTDRTQPTGRVVGILNRNWRSYVATIQEKSSEGSGGSSHLAVPLDPAIPKIRIRHHDVKMIENQRIVVRIDSWHVSSQYPDGHYVRSLGPIHQLNTEISAILVEHGISVSQASQGFSEASLKEMPTDTPESPWNPDSDELARRRDLRSLTVFSIDPPNCQDIDDALSVREMNDGYIELGVHIADVSYFVKENSMTDLEARSRGTTVYLADRRFDMLPSVLSERVCSLRGNVDRYAVSVLWILDKSFEVKDTWFGRSVIRSTCEMEYEQAQQLLDGKPVATNLDRKLSDKLKPCVKKLAEILRVVRIKRLQRGGLELESSEVKFKMGDNHQVSDIIPKDSMEIHGLVAEAMIMANNYVGKRIYDGFKDAAILRRHPPPSSGQFEMLVKAAKSKGFSIDYSSNRALAQSLEAIAQATRDDPETVRLIKTMATVAMNEAGYISSGHFAVDQYFHYGLALDFYTHFTSPIRRYADVIAHRQLLLCVQDAVAMADLGKRISGVTQNAIVSDICQNLNHKSRESKFAQRDSTELFQGLYVMQHTLDGPLIERGVIAEIRSNGFFVFIPRLGLKGPLFLKDKDGQPAVPLSLQTGKVEDDDKFLENCSINIDLPTKISVENAALPRPIEFQLFDHVRVSLKLRKSHHHRHMVYMNLLDLEHTEMSNKSTVPVMSRMSNENMMKSIASQEEAHRESLQANSASGLSRQEIETRRQLKKASNKGGSVYDMMEQFRKLSIIESTSS